MIDEVGFDAHVPRQHVRDEAFRERWLVTQKAAHDAPVDDEHGGRRRRGGRPVRTGCPVSAACPKKSPRPTMATTASLPVRESTEILMLPFWMYMTGSLGCPLREDDFPLGYVLTRRGAPADVRQASVSKAGGFPRG
jgi:hypothetical protein